MVLRAVLAGVLSALLCAGMQSGGNGDEVAFQAAIQKEVVDGDLAGAIKLYATLAKSADRTLAAKALLRMGRCYERSGDAQAIAVYERVLRDFADQENISRQAAERLAVLGKPPANAGSIGWYNGDWQSGLPGLANWWLSREEFSRVYDDFVVPEGGWTVTAVFSNNRMDFAKVTHAAWEIRSGIAPGRTGRRIASGVSRATQTPIPGSGPFPRDPLIGYRIQVDGLRLRLAPGRYWLNVAPIGIGNSFASATKGKNGGGDPPGNNGLAYFLQPGPLSFVEAESMGLDGQKGVGRDFSQGVMVVRNP